VLNISFYVLIGLAFGRLLRDFQRTAMARVTVERAPETGGVVIRRQVQNVGREHRHRGPTLLP
jgi:hypothetical protein